MNYNKSRLGFDYINIFGLRIDKVDYNDFLVFIESSIQSDSHVCAGYANAHVLNTIYHDYIARDYINSFDVIHPDGIGSYLASRFLFGKNGLKSRFTGSDFYPVLAKKATENKWSIFFFGHDANTLEKIKLNYPDLNIVGLNEGYVFVEEDVINKINSLKPQLLIIGLGSGRQEKWLYKNKDRLFFNTAILAGDGIKVFAGTRKRGPKFLQVIGLEWIFRLLANPLIYRRRYLIGVPLFLYRIINKKLSILSKN